VIADDVFIGMQSLILKGVTIGRGSVVTRDMPPGVSFSMSRGGESDAGGEGTGEWSIVKGKWLSDDANGTV
jgi:tetrahydrodipicolinate N-succinyltransferase